MNKNKILAIIIALTLVAVIGIASVSLFSTPSSATSTQSKIDSTLEDLGAVDAQDQGIVADPFDETLEYRLYTSSVTNLEYYFDPDSGSLIKAEEIVFPDRDQTGTGIEPQSISAALSPEQLQSIAEEYAYNSVHDSLFGELRFSSVSDASFNTTSYFRFYEYYNDQKTGTSVLVVVDEDGTVTGCIPKVTTLYQRNEDGTYSLKNGTDFITEEEAMAAAYPVMLEEVEGIMSSMDPDDATCTLTNNNKSIYYVVRYPFLDLCETPCTRDCTVAVDAYTGEILSADHTK